LNSLVDEPPPKPRAPFKAHLWGPLVAGALVGVAIRLLYSGKPENPYEAMMNSFVLFVPLLVGGVAVYLAERTHRRSLSAHFWIGAGANVLFVLATFLITIEGLICVILVAPLFAILGGLGGLVMGVICRRTNWPRQALYSFTALPLLCGGLEQHLPVPNRILTTERSLQVSTTPEYLWPCLATTLAIQHQEIDSAWMYRIGVPVPTSAVSEVVDNRVVRHITMGKGIHFDQVAADWEPNRRVRWTYRFASDSFPPRALDDHVRIGGKYFDVIDTEYSLDPVPSGTKLRVRMTYRVSAPFNWYAGPIAEFLVGNFEEAALRFYAARATKTSN
jgi:hypothetical protein